jgi:hypothetical protein
MYLDISIDAEEYALRWSGPDRAWIGQHVRETLRPTLWPWLEERGYVVADDDPILSEFLRLLGRRHVHLRPGLRMRARWNRAQREILGVGELAALIRSDVDAILTAADEPPLPASR